VVDIGSAAGGGHELYPTPRRFNLKKFLPFLIAFFATLSFAQVSVKLGSPASGSSVGSPFSFSASASSSHAITGWHAYLDGANVYSGGSAGSVSGNLSASTGSHQLVVRAWDSSGAYGSQTITINVTSGGAGPKISGPLPTPPSTALVYTNIDQMSGWNKCGTAACAGGSGSGSFWQSLWQTSPSMDGSSMQLYRDGVWANALWWKKVGAQNSKTHILWDFYVRVDGNAASRAQALEYDAFQFVGGYNYMIGSQCNYAAGVWDTWNEATGHWLHTNIPCPKFSANVWHHIQWYLTTNHTNHTYTYVTLVVDGKAYSVNQTQSAKYLGWGDNLGAQWQLDVNASGAGYHEWVDKAKLTVW
jgi:hypothetical protein